MTLSRRAAVALGVTAAVSALALGLVRLAEERLYRTEHVTGWLAMAALVALTTLSLRKKLPFLPLGRTASWLQVHVYLGLFTMVLFGLHVEARIPTGAMEGLLAALFVLVAGSGLGGLYISRSFARRLTTRGQEVIWERIPALRRQIREKAKALVLRSTKEAGSTAISDLYLGKLARFFDRPAHFWNHVLGSERPKRELLAEVEAFDRYASDAEQRISHELEELVIMKDDLDFHWALQGALKGWLFVHIPATYALLVLALVHGLLAEAFSTGLR